MSKQGVCLDCPNRSIGCHAKCLTYHDWKAKLEKAKAQKAAALDETAFLRAVKQNQVKGWQKRKLKGVSGRYL